MESWEDDNFKPIDIASSHGNKWEGEDEDDEVKDCWEDEDEEKEKSDESDEKPAEPKLSKKKQLAQKIAAKEAFKKDELERRQALDVDISEDEKRIQQQESDLNFALETTFRAQENTPAREQFDELANNLIKKVQPLTKHSEYPGFTENVVRNLCASLNSLDLKKIKTTIDNLYMEKQKLEKGEKTKKSKTKIKAKLKMDDQFSAYVDTYDDFDNFI